MKRVFLSYAAAFAVTGLLESASAGIKAYELKDGSVPLKVDADFSDWKHLAWRDDFMVIKGHGKTAGTARFALMRDRTNLYIAFRFDGLYQVNKRHVKHDGDIWNENSVVEIFIARPDTAAGYTQFSLAANGDRQDSADGDSFVTPRWEAVTKHDKKGWQAEIQIPFKEAGLSLDQQMQYEFRMNVCVSLCKLSIHDDPGMLVWSVDGGPAYRNVADMGYVVHDDFSTGCDRAKESYQKRYGTICDIPTQNVRDEKSFLAFKNEFLVACAQKDENRVDAIAARIAALANLPPILGQLWDPDRLFDEKPAVQAKVLESALDAVGKEQRLDYVAAVNEIAHKSFVISARETVDDLQFGISDLENQKGAVISKAKLHVEKFAFLHPIEGYHSDAKSVDLGYPEIVERVRDKIGMKAGESILFRLYVDVRGAKPGKYRGILAARAKGRFAKFPISLEVTKVVLPLPESRTFPVYLFTTIPWGGESAELWAQFFSDHYMTDVSFEQPNILYKGEPVKPYDGNQQKGWDAYIAGMTATNPIPSPADLVVDLKCRQQDERLRACARHRLRVIMSNRSTFIKTEHFPALLAALKECGIPPNDFIYKLGDEDPSLLFLPVAKRLREVVPEMRVTMIPSGTSYWDMKPAIEGFTDFTFSRSSFKMGPQGDEDLRYMRSKGLVLSRYLNDASWAGRTPPLSSRREPWEALIVDGVDGYVCWTCNIWPEIDYRVGYSGYNWDMRFQEFPPEQQIPAFLVYIRKIGEVYHPVSCIRLENIRDGLIDALYYRLAKAACEKRRDAEGLKKLASIRTSQKHTIADYDAARRMMSNLILGQ